MPEPPSTRIEAIASAMAAYVLKQSKGISLRISNTTVDAGPGLRAARWGCKPIGTAANGEIPIFGNRRLNKAMWAVILVPQWSKICPLRCNIP
jgi:hypothetical protein